MFLFTVHIPVKVIVYLTSANTFSTKYKGVFTLMSYHCICIRFAWHVICRNASWTCKNSLNFIINTLSFLVPKLKSLTSCLIKSSITLRKSKALLPSSQSILCIYFFFLKYCLSFQNFLISGNFLKTSNAVFVRRFLQDCHNVVFPKTYYWVTFTFSIILDVILWAILARVKVVFRQWPEQTYIQ